MRTALGFVVVLVASAIAAYLHHRQLCPGTPDGEHWWFPETDATGLHARCSVCWRQSKGIAQWKRTA